MEIERRAREIVVGNTGSDPEHMRGRKLYCAIRDEMILQYNAGLDAGMMLGEESRLPLPGTGEYERLRRGLGFVKTIEEKFEERASDIANDTYIESILQAIREAFNAGVSAGCLVGPDAKLSRARLSLGGDPSAGEVGEDGPEESQMHDNDRGLLPLPRRKE